MSFKVNECSDIEVIKALFTEYSHIKGAESCFVSFDKELNDLEGFYSGGAILVGFEDDEPVACVAFRKINDETCEGKRLFIKPEHRGKGYARIMIKAMTDKASELGFKEVVFTTKPEVMRVGYGLYKRMGFEELSEDNGIVSMRIDLGGNKLEIKEYSNYKEDEILRLYNEVGWIAYTEKPEVLEQGYKNSLLVLAAYEKDELLGIIRVVGDGHTIVFVQDILVFPNYQRKGVGTALLKAVLDRYPEVRQIELVTDNTPKTVAFYKSLGFREFSEIGCCGFMRC